MEELERRSFSIELRMMDEQQGSVLHGYAAVFNSDSQDLGGFIERIQPGSFANTLQKNKDIKALYNHNTDSVLATTRSNTLQLREDDKGLAFQMMIPDTCAGRDLRELVGKGIVDGCSFGFTVNKDSWVQRTNQPPLRILEDVDLWEVSTGVTFPAYEGTSIALRSMQEALKPLANTGAIERQKRLLQLIEAMETRDKAILNRAAFTHAKSLISSGMVDDGAWSFGADDGNQLLGKDDWNEYAKWFLGLDPSQNEESKGHYKYPVGKAGKVYLSALRAIRSRASQQGATGVFDASGTLLELAKK